MQQPGDAHLNLHASMSTLVPHSLTHITVLLLDCFSGSDIHSCLAAAIFQQLHKSRRRKNCCQVSKTKKRTPRWRTTQFRLEATEIFLVYGAHIYTSVSLTLSSLKKATYVTTNEKPLDAISIALATVVWSSICPHHPRVDSAGI